MSDRPVHVVASGHAEVTRAAGELLRAGGNAFDAVVAAAFAASIAEPMFTSLGGGGFLLAHTGGREVVVDFFSDTPGRGLSGAGLAPHFTPMTVHFPASDQVFNVGFGSVAVPGTLRGLLHVHGRFGSVPLPDVLAPAVELARNGVTLNSNQAYVLGLLEPITGASATGRALFAPRGRSPREGETLSSPQLAAFLESLPVEGDRPFYEGEIARQVADAMREGGGLLTRADLEAYRVVERRPLETRYRGLRELTNPPPSFGGALIARSLDLLSELDVPGLGFGSAAHLAHLAAAMEEIEQTRNREQVDPPLQEMAARVRRKSGGTTHISIRDASGNAASMSLSNGEGSGCFAADTGVMLNNMLGEDDLHPDGFHASPPAQRVASMMSPTLLLDDSGVALALGSGGSKRIRTAILQVISNVVDHAMPVREAVESPRLHWDGSQLQLEPGFPPAAVAELATRWQTNEWPEPNLYFGGVHAVTPTEAAADPRRSGHAATY